MIDMETLNILILNWRDPSHPQSGGAEKFTYEIAKRWVRLGHGVHLISGNYPNGQRRGNIGGIEVTRLGGKYSVYPFAALYYQRELRRKYDTVIDEINTVPFLTPLYVKEQKVALIHQLAADILCEELPRIQAAFWGFMESRVLRLYRNIPLVTVSQSTKKDLVKIALHKGNIHVITQGLDHSLYKLGDKASNPQILYVGRLKRFKGIHFLIEAMKQVIQVLPNAKLSVAGRGEPKLKAELRLLTKKMNLENEVAFLDYVSDEKKVKLMQEAHTLVLPSRREGFGLVAIEANACGTPVIATDVPGLRDAVIDGKTGLLVPYGDVGALATAIKKVLIDEELRKSLSQNAVKWAKNFNWDRTANELMDIIKESLSN